MNKKNWTCGSFPRLYYTCISISVSVSAFLSMSPFIQVFFNFPLIIFFSFSEYNSYMQFANFINMYFTILMLFEWTILFDFCIVHNSYIKIGKSVHTSLLYSLPQEESICSLIIKYNVTTDFLRFSFYQAEVLFMFLVC